LALANECLDRMAASPAREHVEKLIHEHLLQIANSVKSLAPGGRSQDAPRNWEEIG